MNKIYLLFIGTLLFSCQPSTPISESELPTEVQKMIEEQPHFNWLLGNWERLDDEEGKQTFENWDKISEDHYSGFSYTLQNGDTLSQEIMQIARTEGDWILSVKVPQETESVSFILADLSPYEFTFVNEVIDFPNTIRYWKNGDKISATISNADLEIPFEFKRLN
jgi:hypothetical protein